MKTITFYFGTKSLATEYDEYVSDDDIQKDFEQWLDEQVAPLSHWTVTYDGAA